MYYSHSVPFSEQQRGLYGTFLVDLGNRRRKQHWQAILRPPSGLGQLITAPEGLVKAVLAALRWMQTLITFG
jgi:hypothetical protein